MKRIFLGLALFSMLFTACNNSNSDTEQLADEEGSMTFLGNWERTFMLGVDSLQYVYYNVYEDSIEYIMEGPLPLNYIMEIDTFISTDNRVVTKLKDVYFVVFVKELGGDSISLSKQQYDTRDEALTRVYPSDTVSGHFSSWYTYYKKE